MNRMETDAEIKLECYIVYAEISIPTHRYILPVLLHVRDMRGRASAESLSSELFPGMEPVSKKILEICEKEELIEAYDGKYSISRTGKDAIKDGKVFVRSPGRMYKIYYTDSTIIPEENRIVRLDADPEGAGYDQDKAAEVCSLPWHIRELKDEIMTPLFGRMQDGFRIDSIHRQAKEVEQDRMTLSLRLAEDGSTVGPAPYEEEGAMAISGKFRISAKMGEDSMEMPDCDGSTVLRLSCEGKAEAYSDASS